MTSHFILIVSKVSVESRLSMTEREKKEWLAHSKGYSGKEQSQKEHLSEVEAYAIRRCPAFLVNDIRLAALFHDFGKYSVLFKRRLEGLESGLDHWSPGAHILLQNKMSELAAITVHAHHVGFGAWSQVSTLRENLISLEKRKLTLANRKELNVAFEAMLKDGFSPQDYAKGHRLRRTVGSMLDARMVLSALVDADYTDTNPSLGTLYGDHLETVRRRHDRALEQAGASHAVIYSGNPKLAFLDDYYHPFKANPHFVSWVPLTMFTTASKAIRTWRAPYKRSRSSAPPWLTCSMARMT